MRYFIGYVATGEIETYYNALTADLHERFGVQDLSKRVPPHITLKPPFDADDISPMEEQVESFLKGKKAMPFRVEGFDAFWENRETIFLAVHADATLDMFLKECRTEFHHMSVARHLNGDSFEEVWGYVASLPNPRFEAWFDNLTLFVLENEKWEVKRTFRFK